MKQPSFKKKIGLVLLGLFLCAVILKAGLRMGRVLFLSIQDHGNAQVFKQKGTYRILCLGESTTALGEGSSYPNQLQNILNERNIGMKFTVINKGACWADTIAVLSQLEDNINKYQPDMVVSMMGLYEETDGYKSKKVEEKRHINESAQLEKVNLIEAEEMFKKALNLYPNNEFVYIGLGWVYQDQGMFASADEMFKKAVEINPENCLVYLAWGKTYECHDSRYNEENSFNKLIELVPGSGWVYIKFGKFLRFQGKFIQAESAFKRAIELNPENDVAYRQLARLYQDQDKFELSEKAFTKAIELNSDRYFPYTELGMVYQTEGKFIQAESVFKRAIELNPESDVAYRQLARLYQDQNKFDLSEKAFTKAIELNPWKAETYEDAALLFLSAGKYSIAKEFQERARKIITGDYNLAARSNYLSLKKKLYRRKIKLVCVQYPMRSVKPLKEIFKKQDDVIFVDNEGTFKDALKKSSYKEYFTDMTGREHTDCTRKGNMLLASNIAKVILKEQFKK